MIKRYFILVFLFPTLVGLGGLFAQENDKAMDLANQEYADKKFVEAEANYRISHSKFDKRTVSPYNLGNSIYKQNQIEEAKYAYVKAIDKSKTKTQKHKLFHNLGNVFMKEKNYTEAVEAYKNALRNNPTDEETRYNYALAKKLLEANPPKNDKNNNPPPSEYAKMMKAKADIALQNNKFNEALDIMSEALRNDATTKYYQDYISKIEDIVKIIKQ
jgi:tetratricopeptide (TPR) repeat protein